MVDNQDNTVWDVCIIGSGPAGATVSDAVLAAGHSVIMIEVGDFVRGRSFDEIMESSEPALQRDDKGTWVPTGYPWTARCVGGGSMYYGGASFRYRDVDFDATEFLGDGDLPVRWPVTQDEMTPFYERIEADVGVSGGGGPSDPRVAVGTKDLQPSHPMSRSGQRLKAGADGLGWTTYRTPLAIPTAPRADGSRCKADAPCMDRLCPWGAKGDAYTVYLKKALRHPNFRLVTKTWASHLVAQNASTADELVVQTESKAGLREWRVRARSFVLAANAIQSAALLLRSDAASSTARFGNATDMVGRGLCFKLSRNVEGYLPSEKSEGDTTSAGPFSTVAFTDAYVDKNAPSGLGGLIYENRHPFDVPMRDPEQILQVECLAADQPQMANRIRLSDKRDTNGRPLVIIDYRVHPRDAARLEWLTRRAEDLMTSSGVEQSRRIETGFEGGSAHLHGTVRAGEDPLTSVTDPLGRLHDSDNVFCADGGTFPFPGGVSPTLTIEANALRIALNGLLPFIKSF